MAESNERRATDSYETRRERDRKLNPDAVALVREITRGAHDFRITMDGVNIQITTQLTEQPWPAAPPPCLDEQKDGPWPSIVTAECVWANGSTRLQVLAGAWSNHARYGGLVGIDVRVTTTWQGLIWVTLPSSLVKAGPDGVAQVAANLVPLKRWQGDKKQHTEFINRRAARMRELATAVGLGFTTPLMCDLARWDLASQTCEPAGREVFERLIKLALVKLPFFDTGGEAVDGTPYLDPTTAPSDEALSQTPPATAAVHEDARRAGIWPLPGGVREYKSTIDLLLNTISEAGTLTVDAFNDFLNEHFDVTGKVSRRTYLSILGNLGLVDVSDGNVRTSERGRTYLGNPSSLDLFGYLVEAYTGMVELLVIAEAEGSLDGSRAADALQALLDTSWKSANQVNFRRNWLLSLRLTERTSSGDILTELGHEALARHADEASQIRERFDDVLEEIGPRGGDDGPEEETSSPNLAPGLAEERPDEHEPPAAWSSDRVDLDGAQLKSACGDRLVFPTTTLEQVAAAVSAGKHILFVGPPGTGKTELAQALAGAAKTEGYCYGAFVATASADWTTFDTIGGYSLQRDGSLQFRAGAFLRALERWQWLLVDELNRADVDRAFGELMTVLSGKSTDTSYELADGRLVRVGPDPEASHPMPKTFRVLATMNTWDKTSLFRLSYAVQRRFAIVHIGLPEPAAYRALLARAATNTGLDAPLGDGPRSTIESLFSPSQLLQHREIGPAVPLDLIRYMRRRCSKSETPSGDALAEALTMFVLPQLEGLDDGPARDVLNLLKSAISELDVRDGVTLLRSRYVDLFPSIAIETQ